MRRRLAALLILLVALVAGCQPAAPESGSPGTTAADAGPSSSPERGTSDVRPIIIDADFDLSDIAAILVLLRDPHVDVRAIAIDGTGLVHCQGGLRVARYLLAELGRADIPFGCGRQRGGDDATPFPDDWRATADAGYGLAIDPRVETAFPPDAVTVIRQSIDASPAPVTIVALGPLTNLEDAFATDPTLPDRIERIHAMLGTVDAPGNVYVAGHDSSDPLEWNAFADPSAVQAVFATSVPIDLIPLDATDDVPVPADLAIRLGTDHSAGAADVLYELLLRHPSRLRPEEGQQLWDELAALTASDPSLVTWDDATTSVGVDGRLIHDPAGRPVRYASAADRAAVEAALLAALRRGGPRATPFELAGTLEVTWDGSTCVSTIESRGPGIHTIRYNGPVGDPSGVLIGGVRSPHAWDELVDLVTTIDLSTEFEPPDWLIDAGEAIDETGAGGPIVTTATLEAATYGPICVGGAWPDLTFRPGDPFEVGG